MINVVNFRKSKELLIALYFFLFVFGVSLGITSKFYNEFRVLQIIILITICYYGFFIKKSYISNIEIAFIAYVLLGSLFWSNYNFIIFDIFTFYLSYKSLCLINYSSAITKFIIYISSFIFIFFFASIYNYIASGTYDIIWYPVKWNIRVYNSYFLVLMIFSTWYLISDPLNKYKIFYSIFIFLALLSILLDGARSVILSFTVFSIIVGLFFKEVRCRLWFPYLVSFIAYALILFLVDHYNAKSAIKVLRGSSSGRLELWYIAWEHWLQSPIFGSGFYQLNNFPRLSAHPHNIFVQVLTEIGVIGLFFLIYPLNLFLRKINLKDRGIYFFIPSILAIFMDMSLSGAHIYPVTQMIILWFFVFLFRSEYFLLNNIESNKIFFYKYRQMVFGILITFISGVYIYLFLVTSALENNDIVNTPPRFWEYGYRIF